jgi:hypothetical protein
MVLNGHTPHMGIVPGKAAASNLLGKLSYKFGQGRSVPFAAQMETP